MSSQQDRAEQKRQEKLEQIREQVDSGQLKIRKMTPAERKKNPPRPRPEKRGRG
jgi:anti-sigma28 factor (negative regulator of flagellin synthesis)